MAKQLEFEFVQGLPKDMTLADLIRAADIPREKYPEFHKLRVEAMATAMQVYEDRAVGYNVDHQSFQEQVFGPVSLVSEIFKRARRMAAILSPMRHEPIRLVDLNHIVDNCVDLINYLSWMYALVIIATGTNGHDSSDDAPNYFQVDPNTKGGI